MGIKRNLLVCEPLKNDQVIVRLPLT